VINKYVGTWKWTSGADEFTIVLVKKKSDRIRFSVDVLSGGYKYVKNGVEQINTLNDVNININAPNGPVASFQSIAREGNEIDFRFIDKLKGNKRGIASVVITPAGNTLSMTWSLSGDGPEILLPGNPPYQEGYTVPMDMVLIKQ